MMLKDGLMLPDNMMMDAHKSGETDANKMGISVKNIAAFRVKIYLK